MNDERGSMTVLAAVAVVLGAVLCIGIGRVGGAAVERARADLAADAAALAAADQLALGHAADDAYAAARDAAANNSGRLISCTCRRRAAEVVVAIGRARGHARAEVDRARAIRGGRRSHAP
jgi:secretion/DNA translocation related TadE-like protein